MPTEAYVPFLIAGMLLTGDFFFPLLGDPVRLPPHLTNCHNRLLQLVMDQVAGHAMCGELRSFG